MKNESMEFIYVDYLKNICPFLPTDFDNIVERVYVGEDRNYRLLEEIYKIACEYVKNNPQKNFISFFQEKRNLSQANLFICLWECDSNVLEIDDLDSIVLDIFDYDIRIVELLAQIKVFKMVHNFIIKRKMNLTEEESNDEECEV